MAYNGVQGARQFGPGPFQFRPVRQCQPAQNRAAGRGKPDPDFAFVLDSSNSGDSARGLEAVHQFNRAVVLDKKSRRDFPDGRLHALGQTLHSQQQLMLMRLDAMLLRRGLTEVKKLPDLPAELGQIAILIL